MSKTTLDEILGQAYTDGASDTMWQNDRHVEIFATAKQAILRWVADLVGEEIATSSASTRDGMAQVYGENMLKREIREKLKAEGYKDE